MAWLEMRPKLAQLAAQLPICWKVPQKLNSCCRSLPAPASPQA